MYCTTVEIQKNNNEGKWTKSTICANQSRKETESVFRDFKVLFRDFGLQFHDRSHSSRRYASAAQCSAVRLPEAEEMQTKI
jgi:hypothetical protein